MAQLSDDCFAFGGPLMSVEEAISLICERIRPVAGEERVALADASGRILAESVTADVAVPSFDNSAVDGYAVRHGDLVAGAPTILPVSARLPAGTRDLAPLAAGTAARIFTGAPMPDGADTVFMQEDVQEEGGLVTLPIGLKPGANRRFAGEDFQQASPVLAAGTRLDPRHVAALAALGRVAAVVHRRVRVALFSTGDELIQPGEALRPGTQYDSNSSLLATLIKARGAEVSRFAILPDTPAAIAAAFAQAATNHDMILTSGGVSTGEEDHVKAAVEQHGQLHFWRLAIKPGRPVAMGTIGGAAYVGLPGNPVASFVTFVRLAGPLIDQLGGRKVQPERGVPALAGFSYRKKAGRREYLRGRLTEAAGQLVTQRFEQDGAALISSLIGSDGLIELDEAATAIAPGSPVRFFAYGALIGG